VPGYYLHNFDPFLIEIRDGIGVRWYGFAYLLAFIAAWLLFRWLTKRTYPELRPEQAGDFVISGIIFGVLLGGRAGYFLFYEPGVIIRDPLALLRVWEGGMSMHGGMAGLIVFTIIYARRRQLSWARLGDNMVVAAPLGFVFTRCANFINGELYGRVTRVAWAVQFPNELYDHPEKAQEAVLRSQSVDPSITDVPSTIVAARENEAIQEILREILSPRHPSQLYHALFEGLLLFGCLFVLQTRARLAPGVVSGLFLIFYGVIRISLEFFRAPDAPLIGALTRGQFLSLFLIGIGGGIVGYCRKRSNVGGRI
jgi:phosphatidylglycerol---prolipoprotein diacylglyceryl transferase